MNQVAVVIGGGQTLGEFLCRGLAAEGYRVAVVDIQSEKASRVAQEINAEYGEGTAYGFGADATSEASVTALAHGVDEIFTRVDLLVYSAGIAKAAFISDFALGDFDRSLQVNLVGYFLCAREFSRLMIRDGIKGRIIQINSKSGKVGSKHNSGEVRRRRADPVAGAGSGGVRYYRPFADARQSVEIADVPVAAAAVCHQARH